MAIEFASSSIGSFSANSLVERSTTARSLAKLSPSSSLLQGLGQEEGEEPGAVSFESAMLKALDGVNKDQMDASGAIETFLIDPNAIEAHDVTVAMAKANMSLNITRTVLDRVVRAWKDLINTR
jgi:flagellar hook-basal body complex protein FliE